jgi:hypothetical protein
MFVAGFQLADILFNNGTYVSSGAMAIVCLSVIKLMLDGHYKKETKKQDAAKDSIG